MAGKSKIKCIKILDIILLWRVYATNRKEPTTFFFIIKAVNFFNEHPCVCSGSSFLGVISTSTKIVDLYDIAS